MELLFFNTISIYSTLFFSAFLNVTTDLQEQCFEGRHLLWVLFLCIPQLIFYVLAIPIVGVLFLRRNKNDLWTKRVVMFRYGLLFNGYSQKHYFWEGTMAIRKASIVALGVFGSLTGVEAQAHAGLAILMLFLVIHLAAAPYDKRMDQKGVLHKLDSCSLVIIWATLWSGLLFYRGSLNGEGQEILTVVIIVVNLLFTVTGVYLLIKALILESELASTDIRATFTSITKKFSGRNSTFGTKNELHVPISNASSKKKKEKGNRSSRGMFSRHRNQNQKKNTKNDTQNETMIEMTTRRPTIEIFEGADIHANPLLMLQQEMNEQIKQTKQRKKQMDVFQKAHSVGKAAKRWKKNTLSAKKKKQKKEKEKEKEKEKQQEQEQEKERDIIVDVEIDLEIDDVSGRRYSFNHSSGTSEWLDNVEDVEIHQDAVTGKRYSMNLASGVSTWLKEDDDDDVENL